MNKKINLAICIIVLILSFFIVRSFISSKNTSSNVGTDEYFTSLKSLEGKIIATNEGTSFDRFMEELYPGKFKYLYFPSLAHSIAALKANKVQAVVCDLPVAELAVKRQSDLSILPEKLGGDKYGFAFPKNSKIITEFKKEIDKLKNDGTIYKLKNIWTNSDDSLKTLPVQDWPGSKGTVTVVCSPEYEPMTYMTKGGKVIGLDINILLLAAKALDYKLTILTTGFSGVLQGLTTGKYDIACGGISITKERKLLYDFVEYFESNTVLLIKSHPTDFYSLKQLQNNAKTIAYPLGSFGMFLVQKYFPNQKLVSFGDDATSVYSVAGGKADAFVTTKRVLENLMAQGVDGVKLLPEKLEDKAQVAFGISKEPRIKNLKQQLNDFISELEKSGDLEKIEKKWTKGKDEQIPELIYKDNSSLVLKVGTIGKLPPASYIKNNRLCGNDVELIIRFANKIGADIEFVLLDFSSLISAVQAGTIDVIASNLNITEERKKIIDFSEPYYYEEMGILVKDTKARMRVTSIDDLNIPGIRIGYPQQTQAEHYVRILYPNCKPFGFVESADGILSLKINKIDAYIYPRPNMEYYISHDITDDLKILDGNLGDPVDIALAISRKTKIPNLTKRINKSLAKLRADGTLERLYHKWHFEENPVFNPKELPQSNNFVLKVGTNGQVPPYSYFVGKELTGYDIELISLIATELGAKIEFSTNSFAGLVAALETGNIDVIASNIFVTDERKEVAEYSDIIYTTYDAVTIKETEENEDFSFSTIIKEFKQSFKKTFITENRWQIILSGLTTTIIISTCSGILGGLFGFFLCVLRRLKNKFLDKCIVTFIKIIQGLPAVLLLMILYYVIFAKFDIDPSIVAIIGFSINFGVYTSEMMRTALESIDKGQEEAALALGFSPIKSFFKIVFPQAAIYFIPVVKGEFIAMVKLTAIVGYIACQDLTKASDIIRSRTMEAFFPLISTAVIYFITANILIFLLSRIEFSLNPKTRKRVVSGI